MGVQGPSPMMRRGKVLRVAVTVLVVVVLLVVVWEGYKWMGEATGGTWPGTSIDLPASTDDLTLPHAADIVGELFEEIRDGRDRLPLSVFLVKKAWFTLQEAAIGFVLGLVVGISLAILMLRWRVAERGLLPWVNVSQTVPLIALAPIIVTWGRQQNLPDLFSISLIATYLTFFPVAVSALRGLQSPDEAHVELMRSYAAPWRTTLVKLRLPAARVYLFPPSRSRPRSVWSVPSSGRSPLAPRRAWGGPSSITLSAMRCSRSAFTRRSSVPRPSDWSSSASWA